MAKKQQIILTHGTGVPQYKDVKLGEVLVRHAEDV
jgi:formylmethanofuran dehydrogenase subunit D